jgi:hypothetical protein
VAAHAQESKSSALATQLVAALDAAKLESVATKDPAGKDSYCGALYLKGVQLLVVAASYSVPILLDEKLAKKEYRDVYLDLNSASIPASKVFIEDFAGDGLKPTPGNNQLFDAYGLAGKRTVFDGDWRKQQLSEQEYQKLYAAADERYRQILSLLLAELKKGA